MKILYVRDYKSKRSITVPGGSSPAQLFGQAGGEFDDHLPPRDSMEAVENIFSINDIRALVSHIL